MNKTFLEAVRIIFTIIAIILSIITIVMLVIKLLGYSPDESTIVLSVTGILVALQVMVIGILFQIKGDVGELKEFRRRTTEFEKQTLDKIKGIENKILKN